MADPNIIRMTRAQYEATYGQPVSEAPVVESAPIRMTRAQYESTYGVPAPGGSSAGTNVAGGLLSSLQGLTFGAGDEIVAGGNALIDALTSDIGIGDAYDQRLNQARNFEKAFKTSHPIIGGGLEVAGALRNPVRLFKGGGSLLTKALKGAGEGAVMGGAYGFGSGEGSAGKRFEQASDAAKFGGAFGAAVPSVIGGGKKIASKSRELANRLEEFALGMRPSDYSRSLIKKGMRDGDISIRKAVRGVIDRGTFKTAKTATDAYSANQNAAEGLFEDVYSLIDKAQKEAPGKVSLAFPKAEKFISSAPVDDRPALRDALKTFKTLLQAEGDDTLMGLQKNKVALYDKVYGPNEAGREVLDKYLAADLRNMIEKSAPSGLGKQIAQANRKLGEHLEVHKILARAAGREEGTNVFQRLLQRFRTSGGLGMPTLAGIGGYATMGIPGAAGAAAMGGLVGYGTSPRGAAQMAKMLRQSAYGAERIPALPVTPAAKGLLGSQVSTLGGEQSFSIQGRSTPGYPRRQTGETGSVGGIQQGGVEYPTSSNPDILPRFRQNNLPYNQDQPIIARSQGGIEFQPRPGKSGGQSRPSRRTNRNDPRDQNLYNQPQYLRQNNLPYNQDRPMSENSQAKFEPSSYNGAKVNEFISKLPPLIQAVIRVESAGNPTAQSGAGAQGLMQLMPAMQKAFKVSDPFHPAENVRGGTALLEEEFNRFKDKRLALAAYNAGSPAVNRAIKKAGSRDWNAVKKFLPKETRDYVPKVLREEIKLTEV